MRQIKKMMQRGLLDAEQEDPFTLFVASTNIRYCYYAESHKILGQTFGMCVLQVQDLSQKAQAFGVWHLRMLNIWQIELAPSLKYVT